MLKVANSVINASQIATPITFAGDVTLSTGNLVIGTAGKGIDFSATAGTGTSELLADYEEGTFTPTLTATTPGNISVTYSYQNGRYIKVGSQVTISVFVLTSAFTHTTASGTAVVTGIPFASPATILQPQGALAFQGITKVGYTNFTAFVSQNSVVNGNFTFYGSGTGVASSQLSIGDFPTSGTVQLAFTITYFV
jgi:hypothetical protein